MKLILNLKVGTRLAAIPTIIVVDTTRTIIVITLLENDNEDNSTVRVVKLVSLNYYNSNRERRLLNII